MKTSQLKQLIKEEIKRVLNENDMFKSLKVGETVKYMGEDHKIVEKNEAVATLERNKTGKTFNLNSSQVNEKVRRAEDFIRRAEDFKEIKLIQPNKKKLVFTLNRLYFKDNNWLGKDNWDKWAQDDDIPVFIHNNFAYLIPNLRTEEALNVFNDTLTKRGISNQITTNYSTPVIKVTNKYYDINKPQDFKEIKLNKPESPQSRYHRYVMELPRVIQDLEQGETYEVSYKFKDNYGDIGRDKIEISITPEQQKEYYNKSIGFYINDLIDLTGNKVVNIDNIKKI